MYLPQEYQELYDLANLSPIVITFMLIGVISFLMTLALFLKLFLSKFENVKFIFYLTIFMGITLLLVNLAESYYAEDTVIDRAKLLETTYYKSLDEPIREHLNRKVIKTNDKVVSYDLYQETKKYNEAIKTLN